MTQANREVRVSLRDCARGQLGPVARRGSRTRAAARSPLGLGGPGGRILWNNGEARRLAVDGILLFRRRGWMHSVERSL